MLNDKNEFTEKVIHLMVTNLCNRNCTDCCNKQYNIEDIPIVTDEELRNAEVLCLTGGEPFAFADPSAIANYYRQKYENIQKIYAYTNARELYAYLSNKDIYAIDGLNVSIKTVADLYAFNIINKSISKLKENRLYIFHSYLKPDNTDGYEVIERTWQKEFIPSNDSIFRRMF